VSIFDTLLGQTRGSALLDETAHDEERKLFDAAFPVDLSASRRRGPPPPVSDAAVDLIVTFEVSSAAVYEARYRHPVWPKGQSGVTIGIGYDCGYVTADQLSGDWLQAIGEAAIATLQPVCGLKGADAQQATQRVQSVDVPFDAADAVFRNTSLADTIRKTVRALPDAATLSPDCLGALVSLVYNRGAAFSRPEDRYREMRAIAADVENARLADIPAQFRSMKRLWENDPAMAGLVRRRELEALLFEQGLK
jgi:GH24 family phage-related lysozyme (muramidase)